MTEGRRYPGHPSDVLVRSIREQFELSLDAATDGWRGEESVGWRVPSPDGDRFVQLFPTWRQVDELSWSDEVAASAASHAPTCVHAIAASDGRVAFPTDIGPFMVFPFVDGVHPEDDRAFATRAAELLAAIHRGIASTWTPTVRSPGRGVASIAPTTLDARLVDPKLDDWERSLEVAGPPRLPIHGDFYGGNLLVADADIVGVIDWSEAQLEHREQEVAWAMWEFSQNDEGDDLVDLDGERFLQAYRNAGGDPSISSRFDPIPWIRRRLRREAGAWFRDLRLQAGAEAGAEAEAEPEASTYHETQVRAFHKLRDRQLPGRGLDR
jgi:Ser/Thr protein kinase RdoA (MazF antagonist)